MLDARYDWKSSRKENDELVNQFVQELDISPVVAQLLVNRDFETVEETQKFLNPDLNQVHDPNLMHDMQKAVDRITSAIEAGDKITVYGDYDADGITSTAVMYETLMMVGAEVDYYVPNRFTDGYGPNVAAFDQLIDSGTKLFVTVDNGVAGNDAIAHANDRGIDVVVTDHHELPEQLPDAYAIVHPRYPGTEYPFGDLSGVGVAFKVAWALLEELPVELLDLVAIGEVADLVSVTGENRSLITAGLQQLRQGSRQGLHALVAKAGLNEQQLTETNIGFGIAPRLNALGRMDDANAGVQLLTTLDEDEAKSLADEVEQKNSQRQKLVADITDEAIEIANDSDHKANKTLVVAGEGWHEGVLGIVASRLVEQTGKPTIVLNIDSEKNIAKGSGRSIDGFDLFAAVDQQREITTAFGGHQMAIGLSVPTENLAKLGEVLETATVEQQLDDNTKPDLKISATIAPSEIDLELYNQIERLAPFGPGNLRPNFEIDNFNLSNVKTMGKTNKHLKFQISGDNTDKLNVIAFNQAAIEDALQASPVDLKIVVTIDLNEWQGRQSVQLMLKDLSLPGTQIIDQRTNKLAPQLFEESGQYVFFNKQLAEKIGAAVEQLDVVLADAVETHQLEHHQVIVVDCPTNLTDLQTLFEIGGNPSQITMMLYQTQSVYLSGMPSRAEFATLFKFVQTHQNVDVHSQITQLSQFLKIDRNKLIFMIQVFFEVGFVKIDGGILNRIEQPSNAKLEDTEVYKQREAMMEAEKTLIYSDSTTLRRWVENNLAAN